MPDTGAFFDNRVLSILDAAKHAFAEKGFDGASMQDIARAAGMSAGNFYRYFPSKNAIIEALIARDLSEVRADFEVVEASSEPISAMMQVFERRLNTLHRDDGPLWAEIDAAASRKPEVAAMVNKMEEEVSNFLSIIFARLSQRPVPQASDQFSAHSCFVMMIFKAAAQRLSGRGCTITEDTYAKLRSHVLRTLQQAITEIAEFPPESPG